MACTGIEFCKLAIVDTKERAARPGRRARAAVPRARHPDHGQRQRLPQRLRPHPGRRHRPQGPARDATTTASRSRASRCTSAAPPGCRPNFGRKLRAHKVTSAGLDDYITHVVTNYLADREDGEPFADWVARADEDLLRGDKLLEGLSVMSERAVPFHCPYCGERGPAPARGRLGDRRGQLPPRHLGMPRVPARLQPEDARLDPTLRSPVMTAATTTDRPQQARDRHRRPFAGGAARARVPLGRRARARPRRGDRRVGRRDVRRAVLRDLLDGRRRARRHRLARSRPASTWSSSTPATTSSRPSAPATPSRPPCRSTCSRSRPCSRSPSRTRRTARTSTRPTPTCAASCARSSRSPTRLDNYDAWATGLRRAETHNRVIAPVIGWDAKKQKVKVSPLARWSDEQVERYIADNGVLVNPLVYDGYPSIGCWPCTRRVAPGDDPRSGRWAGTNKTECGIHS